MLLVVGEIVRPHGVRGEVVVDVRTDEPGERFAPGAVLVTDPGTAVSVPGTLTVEYARPHLGRLIVAFEGVEGREAADGLRRVLLCVDSAAIPPPADPDEFHDHQLLGLTAVDPEGEKLGEVVRIDHGPAADMLVLRRPDGGTALVPFVSAMVPEVDLAGGRLVMTLPGGLLDL
jgi:16S rRNA processing protein RimM